MNLLANHHQVEHYGGYYNAIAIKQENIIWLAALLLVMAIYTVCNIEST